MPTPIDLTEVIEDSISDAIVPDEVDTPSDTDSTPVVDTPVDTPVDAPAAPVDGVVPEDVAETPNSEVASPAAKQPESEGTTDKRIGFPSHTNGRENRIPYSRVTKIVDNAVKPHLAKVAELEPKVKDYEGRLAKVAEFEQVMVNDAPKFLEMLSNIPAYQTFFQAVQQLQTQAQTQAAQTPQAVDNDPMPQPDDAVNGTYTMNGLKGLLDWQGRQVEARVKKEVSQQYDPIRKDWEAQQQINVLVPQIQAKIKEAQTWPLFSESEPEIVSYLNKFPQAQLEDAYRVIVFPKLQANRDSIRQQVLTELKTAPASTSTTARPTRTSPIPQVGPRSLEDIIKQQIDTKVGAANR